jgi:hypothetical protein
MTQAGVAYLHLQLMGQELPVKLKKKNCMKGEVESHFSGHVAFKTQIIKQHEISITNLITSLAIILVTKKIKQYHIQQRMSFIYEANC